MRHTLAPRKHLGQHFLADDNIARKIAAAIAPAAADVMVEIGPGEGALTVHLAGKAGTLYAVEVDDRAVELLQAKFGDTIRLIHNDALLVSLRKLSERHGGARLRIAGNIPYNITSPLLFHLFDEIDVVHDAVFMMQREVADRLVAIPRTKAYGILSVMTQFYTVPKKLFTVSPGSFFPPPAVMSAVIALDATHAPHYDVDATLFSRVVRGTFGKRRKVLSNGLGDVVKGDAVIQAVGTRIDLSRRPEELTVADFVTLTNALAAEMESA